jgi:cytochrome c-type biogenesis protein CcmF
LYPLFLDAVGGPKLSVGFPFFNATFVPLMVPMLLALAIGPLLAWKRGDLLGALQRLWAAFAASALVILVVLYATQGGPILAVLGLGLAAFLGVRLRQGGDRGAAPRRRPAHRRLRTAAGRRGAPAWTELRRR